VGLHDLSCETERRFKWFRGQLETAEGTLARVGCLTLMLVEKGGFTSVEKGVVPAPVPKLA
jgi:hypothetical protein